MKTVMLCPCEPQHVYHMCDPDAPSEIEFESFVVRALGCMYPGYQCIIFGGRFNYNGDISKPDLALIARDRSHWFVIEVELLSHSLNGHVLPQIRSLQYGEPMSECAFVLSRELAIDIGQAQTLVERVPRVVAVIANGANAEWEVSLRALQAQFLSLTRFISDGGGEAFEMSGTLVAVRKSLGFGTYSAVDSTLRFSRTVDLPTGLVQLDNPEGGSGVWHVRRDDRTAWVTKEAGRPDIPDGTVIQIIRTFDGRIAMRR